MVKASSVYGSSGSNAGPHPKVWYRNLWALWLHLCSLSHVQLHPGDALSAHSSNTILQESCHHCIIFNSWPTVCWDAAHGFVLLIYFHIYFMLLYPILYLAWWKLSQGTHACHLRLLPISCAQACISLQSPRWLIPMVLVFWIVRS